MIKLKLQLIICLLCMVAGVALMGCSSGETPSDGIATGSNAGHKYITPTPVANGPKDEVVSRLPVCDNAMVRTVVSAYYQALKRHNVEGVKECVLTPVNVTADSLAKYNEIADIKIKRIYSIEGSSPVEFICYVYYDVTLNDIVTTVPALDELYITLSGDDYKIINGTLTTSVYNANLSITSSNSDIAELTSSINKLFAEAVESDPALKVKFNITNDSDDNHEESQEGEDNSSEEGSEG